MYPQAMFSSENYLFTAVKNCIILNGRVFVMVSLEKYQLKTRARSGY